MPQTAIERNPFLLMMNPEAVLAAVEKSERLSGLNRHLCRPLDRPLPAVRPDAGRALVDDDVDDDAAV